VRRGATTDDVAKLALALLDAARVARFEAVEQFVDEPADDGGVVRRSICAHRVVGSLPRKLAPWRASQSSAGYKAVPPSARAALYIARVGSRKKRVAGFSRRQTTWSMK